MNELIKRAMALSEAERRWVLKGLIESLLDVDDEDTRAWARDAMHRLRASEEVVGGDGETS
ncbi:MAG: hypothetical protein AAFU79_31705 [Myxococcota bacterium]